MLVVCDAFGAGFWGLPLPPEKAQASTPSNPRPAASAMEVVEVEDVRQALSAVLGTTP